MAEIDDLFLALERADAAGNKEDARELAKMIAKATGRDTTSQEPPVKQNTSNLGDIVTAFKQGVVGAGKSLTDIAGADNPVSEYLGGVQEKLGKEYRPQRIEEMQKRQQLIDEAAKSGSTLEEIKAYLGGVTEAPLQSGAQAMGSFAPYVITGGIGAGARAASLAVPTARAINTGLGALQGIGSIKGSIYENVKRELENKGESPEIAAEKASQAQAYSMANVPQLGLGAALGAVAGRYGAENLVTPGVATRLNANMLPRAGMAALSEAVPEGFQAGQEQYATNQALIREGFDIDPMQGVLGSAARDAAIGALTAAPIGAISRGETAPTKPVLEPTKAEEPEELAKQSNPNIYNPEVRQSAPQIAEMLLPEMKRFGLENVGLKIMDSIENGRADGMWANNIVHVALDKPNPMGSMRHESVHALRQLGGFQDNEWSALTNKAKGDWLKTFIKDTGKYNEYKKIYQQENKTLAGFEDYIHEEAIAEAFRYFDKNGAPEGMIGAIYEKLKLMFEALRNGFTGAGFQTADSIFRSLESGTREQVAAPNEVLNGARFSKPDTRRLDMNFKQVAQRIPELQEAMAKMDAGQLTGAQYDKLVNRYKPIIPYDFVPTPATKEEAVDAIEDKETYGVPAKTLKTGHPVGLRLDIPAYTRKGVWVPTVHEQASGFGAGKKIGHESVAELTDATFGMSEKAASSIAGGKPKGTIATIKGNWKKSNEKTAVAKAQAALNDPAWTQVGMDPERHSYFYDRKTTQPILSADEVIQIGPLVLAKNAKFGSKKDFKYSLANASKVEQVQFLDQEIQDLVKNVGKRIAGMKSDETLEDVKKAVAKLQQYTAEGIKGKDWYEKSAAAVLSAFNGDPILAEKFFQIIAITSANTEVGANFTKAVNGWTQFAEGRPIKVGTENENKKVDALLNFGEDWGGRKTNTFYSNLMEAMEGKDNGRSTIDLHMTRMIFGKDVPTDAQYELAENMVRLLANKAGMVPRQVQAASWVTQKAKSMFDLYRQKGWKKNLSDAELREITFEKAVGDYSHQIKARTQALPVTEALKEPSPSIKARTQNITGEIIPSVQTPMGQAEEMAFKFKEKITKQIANSDAIPKLIDALGIKSKVKVTVGSGAYASKVNPNLIVKVINDNPEEAQRDALDLANAMSYVFKQDATPLYRADPKLLGQNQLGHKIKFDTADITPTQQKKMLAILQKRLGEDAGFTKINNTELVTINYRGEDGNPFLTTDEDFMKGLAEIQDELSKVSPIESQEMFGAQSEYPYHDWKDEPSGAGIITRLQDSRRDRPNLRQQLDNLGESFISDLRNTVRESGATPRFSLSAPDTPEVKAFMNRPEGDSKIVNKDGSPKILFHGTAQDITEFKPKQANAIFLTDSPRFAEGFTDSSRDHVAKEAFAKLPFDEQESIAKEMFKMVVANGFMSKGDAKFGLKFVLSSPDSILSPSFRKYGMEPWVSLFMEPYMESNRNIIPVYVYAKKPFDYQNQEHLKELLSTESGKDIYEEELPMIASGAWTLIEKPHIQKAIKEARFDGFYVKEGGLKNLAVYDSSQIKSAFNKAPTAESKDIRFSLALDKLEPDTFLTSDKNPNALGNLGFMPVNSPFPKNRPIRLQIGTRGNEKGKAYGAKHILERALTDVSHRPVAVTKEALEDTILHIESLAKRFNRVYADGSAFILYDSQTDDAMVVAPMNGFYGVTTMYSNPNVQRRYGNPKWSGRNIQPPVEETGLKAQGISVRANEEGDIVQAAVPKAFKQAAKTISPNQIDEIAQTLPRKAGTLGIKKKLSIFSPEAEEAKQQIIDGAKDLAKMSQSERESKYYADLPQGPYSYALYEAQKLLPKPSDKLKRVNDRNTDALWHSYEWIANVDGTLFVLNKREDPDYDPYGTREDEGEEDEESVKLGKYNYAYTPLIDELISGQMAMKGIDKNKRPKIDEKQTWHFDQKELFNDMRESLKSPAKLSLAPNAPPQGTFTTLVPNETAGKRLTDNITNAMDFFKDPERRLKARIAFIDPNSGLARSLQNSPIYDANGVLRADLLARGKAQTINIIQNGLQTGIPIKHSDGSVIIQRDDVNNLANSQAIADRLNDNQYVTDSGLSGRGYVAEVARALRGKEIMAEDAAFNKTQKNVKKHVNREKQIKPEQIAWAEQQLKNVPELEQIFDIWKNVNTGLLNLWEETGLLDKKQADEYRSKKYYVSLAASNADLEEMMERQLGFTASGLKSTPKIHKLKGSSDLERNIWENIEKQYASMLAGAYQNQVRKVAVEQLIEAGAASIPSRVKNGKTVGAPLTEGINLRYKDPTNPLADNKGVVHAIVDNPVDLAAFESFHYELNPLMKFFGGATNILRAGALINPMFWIRQLIRDPIHAALVANSGITTPFHSAKEFINILAKNSPEARILAERGVIGQYDSTVDLHSFLEQAGKEQLPKGNLNKLYHKLMQIHEASDAATRVSIFKKEKQAGLDKGMTEEQATNFAVMKARESINFMIHGNSKSLNALRQMIPFLSASITSLDTVYRAATGYNLPPAEKAAAQKLFKQRAALMLGSTIAYAMLMQDDDEYKKLPDYVKDNNWLIKNPLGEGFIKVAVPYEVGFLFKTLPEVAIRGLAGNSTGKEMIKSYYDGFMHNLPTGGVPVPQAVKPALEVITNYSFFTGNPIESIGEGRLPVEMRGRNASETAKFLSKAGLGAVGLSPAKIDALVQGYMAEAGTFTFSLADSLITTVQGKEPTSKNLAKQPFFKSFLTDENSNKAVSDFYQIEQTANQVAQEFSTMTKTGLGKEAVELMQDEDKRKLMASAPALRRVATSMTSIRKAIEATNNNQSIPPDERRDMVNKLTAQYNRVAEQGVKLANTLGIR
jgi:hypothetical protein